MAADARLADLCEAIVDCPHSTPAWKDHGVVVLRNQNIRNGRLDLGEPSYTDEAHFIDRTRRAVPSPGDLVITREAPMGDVCMIPPGLRCCLGQRMVLLRPNRKRAEPRYLLYALQSKTVQHEIGVNEGTGSTVSNLRIPLLASLPIPARSLPEQRAIAHILGTLDDKIELNRRRNATLEAMARALFKAWFVDFEPVRAKLEGRWQRGHSLPGLPAHLYNLFPDRLVDSELGEIPEGWRIGKFGQVVRQLKEPVNPGDSPATLFAHYSLPAFDGGQSPVIESGEAIKSNKWRVELNTVLLSKLNPKIDRTWLADIRGDAQSICSTEFLVLAARKPFARSFVYSLARSEDFRQQLESLVTGTSKSHQRAQPAAVVDIDVVLPPEAAATTFEHLTSGWFAQTQANRRESRTLATLRDTLLPKLISGELRVPEAGRLVKAVA